MSAGGRPRWAGGCLLQVALVLSACGQQTGQLLPQVLIMSALVPADLQQRLALAVRCVSKVMGLPSARQCRDDSPRVCCCPAQVLVIAIVLRGCEVI